MLSVCFLPSSRAVLDCFHQNLSQPCWFHPPDVIAIMNNHNKWTCGDSNPGPTGYEPVALTNWATGPHMKADERTRTVNLLITNQLLCQLSHIGALNLIACRSKTSFSRSRCNRLCNENINLTSMQAFVRLMFPSCTQSLFRENWATSAYEFLSDSKGIWTPVTAVKGRCLNRLTMEPCFLSLSLFVFSCFFFPLSRPLHLFFNAKKLPE